MEQNYSNGNNTQPNETQNNVQNNTQGEWASYQAQNTTQQPYQNVQPVYQNPVQPSEKKSNPVGIAALVCGIVAFFFNPCYLTCLAAIILGIVGLTRKDAPKGLAIAGLILGCCAIFAQLIFDILTLGIGFFF